MDLSTTFASIRKQVAGLSVVALVTGLFATGVATAATGNVFSDVPTDAWFAPYVNGLSEQGVIDSTSDMYRPGDLVNRAEMAKFAFMVSGLPLETAAEAPYKDVAMGEWYTDYVYTLTKNGIVSGDKLNGVPTGFFRPSDALNRAEAAKMLVNSAQMAEDLSGAPHFPDVTTSDWFYNYVETLFNNGVVAGYPDGYFRPANNINRAEVAKMVYLSMNPVVAGFTLDSAAAASATKVELIFSMNVDSTSAEVVANYAIEDSSGTKLEVTDAEVVAGDTVHLTTKTQTAGKVYYVTVKDIESEAGDMLANWDSVSFLGYGADVSGGPLTVSLSTQTPVAGSVPSGATGVVFTCWDFKAGSDDAVVKSLHVHRVGPGASTAFTNLYLYRGDSRLTTGRTINSETQMVEFRNINQTVDAGENAKMCLVGDLAALSDGGVHAFQLLSADHVVTNSSDLTGSFPLRGADQLITKATVGQTTVRKNGALDELTVGQAGGTIAQFELEADGAEDQYLNRVALYVRGSVTVSDIKNLKLYALGDSTALASATEVGAKDLATFTLAKPYKIGRGQKKIFYVTADLSPGRNGDNIKVYLDEATDLFVQGATYGYGTRVVSAAYDGGNPDGIDGNVDDKFSYTIIKGSAFNIAFTGPSAQDVAIGQTAVRCLDLTITNGSGSDVEIKNWEAILDIQNPATTANGGLWNDGLDAGNYTLIKLARLNDDGTVAGTLLGPTEVVDDGAGITALDDTQTVILGGTATIAANESVKAAIIFNTANNAAMAGDKIRCSLKDLTGVADSVRDENGDALTASSITPAAQIDGNTLTVVQSALKVAISATPSSKTVVKGSNNVDVLGLSLVSGSSLDNTLKTLTIQGWVDATAGDLVFGTPADNDNAAVLLKDVINNLALYDGATQVGTFGNISSTSGKVTFNNLTVNIPKNTTKTLTLRGNLSNSAPNGVRIKFGVAAAGDVVSIDQNGQTVTGIDVSTADNGNTADSGVRITINNAGTVAVAQSGSADGALLGGLTPAVELAKAKFSVTNAEAILDDFSMGVSGEPASLSKVYVYDATCSSVLGSAAGYDIVNGAAMITGAGITLPVGNTTLCFKGDIASVGEVDQPVSGSFTGLYLRDITKLSSGGSEISNTGATAINSNALLVPDVVGTQGMTNASTGLCTATNPGFAVGNLVWVEKEMMMVTTGTLAIANGDVCDTDPTAVVAPAGTFTTVVARAVAGTSAVAHAAGAEVRLPNFAVLSGSAAVKKDDVVMTLTGTDVDYYIALQDNPTFPGHAVEIYADPVATAYAPAATVARFNLHGNSSILRKAKPTIAVAASPASGSTLAAASQFVTMGVEVTASGEGQVELTPANANTMTFVVTGAGLAGVAAGNYCALYNAGGTKLASVNTAASPATLAFTMGTLGANDNSGVPASATGLTVPVGTTARVELRCTTVGGAGNTLSATMTGMTYGDGTTTQTNILTDGSLITQKFPLNGPTFTQP